MPVFYHEKLPVYQQALNFAVKVDAIVNTLPRERWSLKDQLWRASTSIPFNIAEGTAGQSDATRLYFFKVARGSAAECSSIFDYLAKIKLVPREQLLYEEVRAIGAQLGRAFYQHLNPKA